MVLKAFFYRTRQCTENVHDTYFEKNKGKKNILDIQYSILPHMLAGPQALVNVTWNIVPCQAWREELPSIVVKTKVRTQGLFCLQPIETVTFKHRAVWPDSTYFRQFAHFDSQCLEMANMWLYIFL